MSQLADIIRREEAKIGKKEEKCLKERGRCFRDKLPLSSTSVRGTRRKLVFVEEKDGVGKECSEDEELVFRVKTLNLKTINLERADEFLVPERLKVMGLKGKGSKFDSFKKGSRRDEIIKIAKEEVKARGEILARVRRRRGSERDNKIFESDFKAGEKIKEGRRKGVVSRGSVFGSKSMMWGIVGSEEEEREKISGESLL